LRAMRLPTPQQSRMLTKRPSLSPAALPGITKSHGGERQTIAIDLTGDGTRMLTLETGLIGKQAAGAVVASSGGTVTFNTVCYDKKEGDYDFCPLKVDYQERTSAAGRTKGGFLKRDGRPTEDEILVRLNNLATPTHSIHQRPSIHLSKGVSAHR
jgi:hypothetical protein